MINMKMWWTSKDFPNHPRYEVVRVKVGESIEGVINECVYDLDRQEDGYGYSHSELMEGAV